MARLLTPSNLKSVKFQLTGLDQYLEKIQKAGKNIDDAVAKAVEESAVPIFEDIRKWAEKHEMTGAVLAGVNISQVQMEGNKFWVEVGIDSDKSKFSWHAVFVEYGSPTTPPDPGIRPAFANNKKNVKQIQRNVLKKGGIPDD